MSNSKKGKVLITGGTGYIGSHTVVALADAGYQPVVIDNFSNSDVRVVQALSDLIGYPLPFYNADCKDKNVLEDIAKKEGQFTAIIHFAAYKSVAESVKDPTKYYENNINSLLAVLELADIHNIPNIIFSSSCTVYGEPDVLPVTELTPIKEAESPYGYTKQVCERIIADWIEAKKKHKAMNLRYFNPVGAHPSGKIGEHPKGIPENLLPYLTQVANGERSHLTVFGNDYNTSDGTCMRDYIHVVDLAHAHVASLTWLEQDTRTHLNEVCNVGVGNGTTVLELIHAFEEVTGVNLNYVVGPRRQGDIEKVYADPTKIKNLTGWKATYTIKEALRDSWNWQKNSSTI